MACFVITTLLESYTPFFIIINLDITVKQSLILWLEVRLLCNIPWCSKEIVKILLHLKIPYRRITHLHGNLWNIKGFLVLKFVSGLGQIQKFMGWIKDILSYFEFAKRNNWPLFSGHLEISTTASSKMDNLFMGKWRLKKW